MRLDSSGSIGTTKRWDVTVADMTTHTIAGHELLLEGGALVINSRKGFQVAFGPGAWIEVQPE